MVLQVAVFPHDEWEDLDLEGGASKVPPVKTADVHTVSTDWTILLQPRTARNCIRLLLLLSSRLLQLAAAAAAAAPAF